MHPQKQNLKCPGCGEKFVTGGALVAHIEGNRCKSITKAQFARVKALQAIFGIVASQEEFSEGPQSVLDAPSHSSQPPPSSSLTTTFHPNGGPAQAIESTSQSIQAEASALISPTTPNVLPHTTHASQVVQEQGETSHTARSGADVIVESPIRQVSLQGPQNHQKYAIGDISGHGKDSARELQRLSRIMFGGKNTISALGNQDGSPFLEADPFSRSYRPGMFRNILGKYVCPHGGCKYVSATIHPKLAC